MLVDGRMVRIFFGRALIACLGTGAVVMIDWIWVFGLVFRGQEAHLLDLTNMTIKDTNGLARIEIPKPDRTVIRGGEDGSRCGVYFHGIDPVSVSAEAEGGFVREVPDLDGAVDGA